MREKCQAYLFTVSEVEMFRIVKNENALSLFSPGFFLYKEDRFFLDEKAKIIFNIEDNKVSSSAFLCVFDEASSALFSKILKSNESGDVVIINALVKKDEISKAVLIQGSVIERDPQGKATCFSGYCVEVKNEFSVPRIYNSSEIGLWEWDGVSGKCNFCRNYHAMLGYDWPSERLPDSFEGWKRLVHPDDKEAIIFQEKLSTNPDMGDKFECFVRLRHKNGDYIWTIGKGFVAQRDHLGRAVSIRGTNQNIDIVQKNYESVLEKTFRDPLTGCHTRDFFKNYWDRIKDESAWPISFLYMDICGLKMINDLLGHDFGDRIIVRLVNVIETVIQMPKYIIRMGGDEFLVVLPECNMDLIVECEKNLNKYMKFKNESKDIPVLFSMGVSSMNGEEDSLTEKINAAERNMQKNKNLSRQENLLYLKSYIESIKEGAVTSYQDSRISL